MANIARAFNFMPSTLIQSAQVNQELNNLVNLLNGTTSNLQTKLVNNDPANSTLSVDQLNVGPTLELKFAGAVQGRFMPNAFLQQQYAMILGPTGSFGALPAISLGNNGFVYGHTSSDPPLATSGFSLYGTGTNNLFVLHGAAGLTGSAMSVYQFPDVVQKATWLSNGKLKLRAGYGATQPGAFVTVGGLTNQDFTTRQSPATGVESTLLSQSFVSNMLGADGEHLICEYAGFFANNGNNKRLRFTFAGTSILDTTLVAIVNQPWKVKITIIRISGTNVKVIAELKAGNSFVATTTLISYSTFAVTFNILNSIVSLGTGTALGDVTQEFVNFYKYGNPT